MLKSDIKLKLNLTRNGMEVMTHPENKEEMWDMGMYHLAFLVSYPVMDQLENLHAH